VREEGKGDPRGATAISPRPSKLSLKGDRGLEKPNFYRGGIDQLFKTGKRNPQSAWSGRRTRTTKV